MGDKTKKQRQTEIYNRSVSDYGESKMPTELESRVLEMSKNPYTEKETQDIRARAMSPIQAAYANSEREMNRAKSLGGAGGSPNYIAALTKSNRDRARSVEEGTTDVNARLAQDTFQNKMSASGLAGQLEDSRKNRGLNAVGNQIGAAGLNQGGNKWASTMGAIGQGLATYGAIAAASDEDMKEDIEPIEEEKVSSKLKDLPLFTWKYKGDNTKHMGPMAGDLKKVLGVGDGENIHLSDAMGVMFATAKENAKKKATGRRANG